MRYNPSMVDIISSPSNPIIKQARVLRQKKGRDESGLFLVEGLLHVGEAFEAGWQIDTLLYAPDQLKSDFGKKLVEKAMRAGLRSHAISGAAFESFAEKENPQGIAAIVRQRKYDLSQYSAETLPCLTAVVSPQDPGNVGTILRTMDAVGINGLVLLDWGVDPYHPSAVRASMGTLFWKSFFRLGFTDFLAWARQHGYRVVGTSAHGSVDYRALKQDSRPMVLLLGSEQKGLSPEQIANCDELVSLPMRGRASSLNLAVAAGVLLYALKG